MGRILDAIMCDLLALARMVVSLSDQDHSFSHILRGVNSVKDRDSMR